MRKAVCIIGMTILTVMVTASARAENDSKLSFQGGVKAGVNMFGLVGPRSINMTVARIAFSDAIFKPGFAGGFEGLCYINQKHSLSLGLLYDQRQISLRIGSIAPALFVMAPLTQAIAAMTPMLAPLAPFIVTFIPYEKLVKETSLSIHSINIPLSYRFHAHEFFYLGLGVDITIPVKAKAEYKFLIPLSMNLKPYLKDVDFGGHLLAGVVYKGVFVEIIGGMGFLDYDKLNDVRRSVYIKGLIGYRFPTK